jgi:hypothetical protein
MRLYLKLTLMIALAVSVQWSISHKPSAVAAWEAWFTVRCFVAAVAGVTAWRSDLIEEYRGALRRHQAPDSAPAMRLTADETAAEIVRLAQIESAWPDGPGHAEQLSCPRRHP